MSRPTSTSKEQAHKAVIQELESRQRAHGPDDGSDASDPVLEMDVHLAVGVGLLGVLVGAVLWRGLR
jgi:hypothetical protein